MTPDIAIVFGTYNRLPRLQACIASIRRAAGSLTYVCLVADGGSTDGSREWLVEQPDCELLEGGLDGAVRAFNVSFARAVDLGSPWVCQFNDDLVLHGALADAVDVMAADEAVGAAAFPSTRYSPGAPEFSPSMRWRGRCYANQGLYRREAGMAAARFLGDPTGKQWWSPQFHTYCADTVLGLTLWRLGWEVSPTDRLWVEDDYTNAAGHLDPLRLHNSELNDETEAECFSAWYGDSAACEYHREDAGRCGGRLR